MINNNTRYNDADYKLFNSTVYNTDFGLTNDDILEFHLYDLNMNHIMSDQNVLKLFWKSVKPVDTSLNSIDVNLKAIFENLQITRGEFKINLNFFRNILPIFYVSRVNGNEIELKSRELYDLTILEQFDPKDFVLNFKNNKLVQCTNIEIKNERTLYIKSYNDLENYIESKEQCTIVYEWAYPVNEKILILDELVQKQDEVFLMPNFDLNVNENVSIATDYENWNTLLGSKLSVLDQVLNNQFENVKLNIQYNDFNNFIHFSSAKERVINFKYKLQELEYYETELYNITNISGSIIPTNITELYNKRNEVLNSFDGFEQHLYYDTSGSLYTHVTGSYDIWPKNTTLSTRTWESKLEDWNTTYSLPNTENNQLTISASLTNALYSVTSSEGIAYFNGLHTSASDYDRENVYALVNNIPEFIKIDDENESFLLFINMMAQHFDLIWLYIKELQEGIFSFEQHPKDGTSLQLLPYIAEMFGWKLESDLNSKELYDYILGSTDIGSPITWNNSLDTKNKLELTGEIWKRVINNLPLILKTKGTKKSVQALLSCYGIPDSILRVKEFGVSNLDNDDIKPTFQDESFKYGLNFNNVTDTYLEIDWGKLNDEYPKALEFRIKFDTDYDYSDTHEETLLELS